MAKSGSTIPPRDPNEAHPKHLIEKYGNLREYKLTKREQLRAASKAMADLAEDGAFLPRQAFNAINNSWNELDRAKWELNLDNWGT